MFAICNMVAARDFAMCIFRDRPLQTKVRLNRSRSMAQCPRCKEEIHRDAVKCKHCYHELTADEQKSARAAITKGQRLLRAIGIAVLAIGALYSFSPSSPPPTQEDREQALDLVFGSHDIQNPQPVDVSERYRQESESSHCKARYPDDFSMRAACGRNARSGFADFVRIRERHATNGDFANAMALCFYRYTVDRVTDFAMVGACARNQDEGFRESAAAQ